MNSVALVTGGNRGIGFEICGGLAQQGITVLMGSRDLKKGELAADELRRNNWEIIPCQLDVADPKSMEQAFQWTSARYGRLDILVNNAAVYPDEGIHIFDLSLDLLKRTFDVNTFGVFHLTKLFMPMMQRQNYGRVVNVSSGAGAMGDMHGDTPSYRLSKLALNGMTQLMANDVQRYNIKINAMCPGWVRTEMGGAHAPRSPQVGADTAIWLATLPDHGPNGGFFRDRKPIAW